MESSVNQKNYDLMIVGGGPAGIAAATEGVRLGFKKILLVEKTNTLGGQGVGGVFKSKYFIRSEDLESFISGYLLYQKESHKNTFKSLNESGVIIKLGTEATINEDGSVSVGEDTITGSHIFWATGSEQRQVNPEQINGNIKKFGSSNAEEFIDEIRKNSNISEVAFIGGGVTSIEWVFKMAEFFPKISFKVFGGQKNEIDDGNTAYHKIPKFLRDKTYLPNNIIFVHDRMNSAEQDNQKIRIISESGKSEHTTDLIFYAAGKKSVDNPEQKETASKHSHRVGDCDEQSGLIATAIIGVRKEFAEIMGKTHVELFPLPGVMYFSKNEYTTIGDNTPQGEILEFELDEKEGAIQLFLDENKNLKGVSMVSTSASTFIHVFQWYIGKPIIDFIYTPWVQSELGMNIQVLLQDKFQTPSPTNQKIKNENKKNPLGNPKSKNAINVHEVCVKVPFVNINRYEATIHGIFQIENSEMKKIDIVGPHSDILQDIANHLIGKNIEDLYAHPFASPSYAEALREMAIEIILGKQ